MRSRPSRRKKRTSRSNRCRSADALRLASCHRCRRSQNDRQRLLAASLMRLASDSRPTRMRDASATNDKLSRSQWSRRRRGSVVGLRIVSTSAANLSRRINGQRHFSSPQRRRCADLCSNCAPRGRTLRVSGIHHISLANRSVLSVRRSQRTEVFAPHRSARNARPFVA